MPTEKFPKNDPPSPPKSPSEGGYAFGRKTLQSLLQNHTERVFKIFVDQDTANHRKLHELIQMARDAGKPVQKVPRMKLDKMVPDEVHQGIVAMVAPKPLLDDGELLDLVRACPEENPPLLLALDGITDTRNFGALIRVAAGAGVTAIIIPEFHSAGFTPAVEKVSAGTADLVPIAAITNLVTTMERLKKHGMWWAGAALDPKAVRYDQYDYKGPTGIVMGSEDKGIRNVVRKACDQLVQIPMAPGVESLNVSVAGGVLLFEARRQRLIQAKVKR